MLQWQRVDVWKGNGGGLEETVVAKEMEVDGGWMEAASCLNMSAKRPHAFRACIWHLQTMHTRCVSCLYSSAKRAYAFLACISVPHDFVLYVRQSVPDANLGQHLMFFRC